VPPWPLSAKPSRLRRPRPGRPPRQARQEAAGGLPQDRSGELPGEEFEAAVRLKVDKKTAPLTRSDLGRLKSLNVSQIKLVELDVACFRT